MTPFLFVEQFISSRTCPAGLWRSGGCSCRSRWPLVASWLPFFTGPMHVLYFVVLPCIDTHMRRRALNVCRANVRYKTRIVHITGSWSLLFNRLLSCTYYHIIRHFVVIMTIDNLATILFCFLSCGGCLVFALSACAVPAPCRFFSTCRTL